MTATARPRTASTSGRRSLIFDLLVVLAGIALVVTTALVGWQLLRDQVNIFLAFPPLLARWLPHIGPGTPLAVITAAVVVLHGPGFAARARWRPLLITAWATAIVWTTSLALVDGYQEGIATRLTSRDEYLHDIPLVHSIPQMLREFTTHILTDQPQAWTTHVGAHPPGVFLIFLGLDRIGLSGGAPAAFLCILVGSSACVAVAVALRALGHEDLARTVLPFGVLFPGAVWIGVSADGMFAAVVAWGIALLAIGATRREWRTAVAALSGGLLLGYCLYLSYGLVLGGMFVIAVIAATRRWWPIIWGTAGVVVVVAAFTASGFWWPTGYELTKILYAGSIAATRPYSYFLWSNLAALMFAIGPAVLVGLRRLAVRPSGLGKAGLLVAAAVIVVLAADISGLSKGEVERIWLPFAVWLVVACGLLPRTQIRAWLAAQALLALLVNHLLLTVW